MRHSLRCALIAIVGFLCAGAASAESIARVGVAARDLGALDPAFGIGNGDEFTIRQIYNTLVSPPDGTTKIQVDQLQGELAETWEVSPDARTWTFHPPHGRSEDRVAILGQLPPDREHRYAGRLHGGAASQPTQSVHLRLLHDAALWRLRSKPQGRGTVGR